ncbi:MAG: MucR family transcriptional regulator [Deltaproteobacteria bacterium]|nr:MucR family transcriptional regulator [Deltaproteobacteria bacterium]
MNKKLLEIASEIVQTQVSTRSMAFEEIVLSLRQIFNALQAMQRCETDGSFVDLGAAGEESTGEGKASEKLDPKDSIQDDKIICLECGTEMRQLTTKHLTSHGLTPREYKKKWGFPLRQSLSAKSLSKARSKAAKKRGLPANLIKFQEERKLRKAEAAATDSGPLESPQNAEKDSASSAAKRSRKKSSE